MSIRVVDGHDAIQLTEYVETYRGDSITVQAAALPQLVRDILATEAGRRHCLGMLSALLDTDAALDMDVHTLEDLLASVRNEQGW